MKFESLKNKPPPERAWCLYLHRNGWINTQPQAYYQDEADRLELAGYVDYAIIPPHIVIDPTGWLSEYRGDELPRENSSCLVCTENPERMPFYAYFLASKQQFLCRGDVVAYQYL